MERGDGWTKRQRRKCSNGWLHFYTDEDEHAGVSSQPGSCVGAGDATHRRAAFMASYGESEEQERALVLLHSTVMPSISPWSKHGVMSLPEAGKPGQSPAPQTGCRSLSCISGLCCSRAREDPAAHPPRSRTPFTSISAVTTNVTLSL